VPSPLTVLARVDGRGRAPRIYAARPLRSRGRPSAAAPAAAVPAATPDGRGFRSQSDRRPAAAEATTKTTSVLENVPLPATRSAANGGPSAVAPFLTALTTPFTAPSASMPK
jgi:hypothetical protein